MLFRSVAIEKSLVIEAKNEFIYFIDEIDINKVNVIITIGGDGTILWAHRYYKHGNIPPIISFRLVDLNKRIGTSLYGPI